jgi:hypothetical protein
VGLYRPEASASGIFFAPFVERGFVEREESFPFKARHSRGWKPGALAKDEQGRRVEVLSNPCWDDSYKGFRILIRYCPDEGTRMAELKALSS